ncbi:MAG: Ig-like domain-containing protein [Patescibacteria group bacterium]|jgi:hypothetical protein
MGGRNKNKFITGAVVGLIFSLALIAMAVFVLPNAVSAQATINSELGTTFGLGTAGLESTVIKIVQWALGFLGLIAVIMIIYGGVVWMTAAGNTDKVAKAKKIIIRAVIGLVIVLLAWAIVMFIVDRINKATGGGGDFCDPHYFGPNWPADAEVRSDGCAYCNESGTGWIVIPGCVTLPDTDTFRVKWVDPTDGEHDVPLCSIVQAKLNGKVVPASIAGNVGLYVNGATAKGGDACLANNECMSGVCDIGGTNQCVGDEVAGNWQVSPDQTIIEFLPATDYLENQWYRAELRRNTPGNPVIIQEDAADPRDFVTKIWMFTTGITTLDVPPTVTTIYPADGEDKICLNTAIQSIFSSKMRAASMNASTIKLAEAGTGDYGININDHTSNSFSGRPAKLLNAGKEYNVTLTAGDPGNNDPNNGVMDVCLNHLDGDADTVEEGTAGGDNFLETVPPSSNPTFTDAPWNFLADTDTTNDKCIPEITDIVPANGKYDSTAVDIQGVNFGIIGFTYFNKGVINAGNCFDGGGWPRLECVNSWSGNNINIHVPGGPINGGQKAVPYNGAADGPVSVEVAGKTSNNWTFDVASPQILKAIGFKNNRHGGTDQYVTLISRSDTDGGFGDNTGTVVFRSFQPPYNVVTAPFPPDPPCDASWANDQVIIKVPDLTATLGVPACPVAGPADWVSCLNTPSMVGIQLIRNGGDRSNIVNFVYTNEEAGPGLCAIQPQQCGTGGETVTAVGQKFLAQTPASRVHFSAIQAVINSWTLNLVTGDSAQVTVPSLDNAEDYLVTVSNSVGTSNPLLFDVPCGLIPKVVEDSSCENYCQLDPTLKGCTEDIDCGVSGPCVTGISSPNPYKGNTDVCVNVNAAASFNTLMDDAMLTDGNLVYLQKCNDDNCSDVDPAKVAGALSVFIIDPTHEGVEFNPAVNLDPSTTYQMTIQKEVQSEAGAHMNNDYKWHFKTKDSIEPCPVEKVVVAPNSAILYNLGDTQNYSSLAQGPNCTILDPNDYTWAWTSEDFGIASVPVPSSITRNEIATATGLGTTYIKASIPAESKSGRGRLKVDPESCAFNPDPGYCANPGGGVTCPGSWCDLLADKCMPVITERSIPPDIPPKEITPPQGPAGTTVSIEGCWFGSKTGQVIIDQAATFECSNSWSSNLIVATTDPLIPTGNKPVEVLTAYGRCNGGDRDGRLCTVVGECPGAASCDKFSNMIDSGQSGALSKNFNVTDRCSGYCDPNISPAEFANAPCVDDSNCDNVPLSCKKVLPTGGIPGICPPLQPSAGPELTHVYIEGFNLLPDNAQTVDDLVYYPRGKSDTRDDIIFSYLEKWTGTAIDRSRVPVGAESGAVNVLVDNCPSNSLPYAVTCTNNIQCGTGCCADPGTGQKMCLPFDPYCLSGTMQPCQIEENTDTPESPENPNCTSGQIWNPGNYMCISTTGDTSHEFPAPPEDATHLFGTDCRVCCDANPPQVSASGLTCRADKGDCSGTERGLYCGCDPAIPGQCGAGFGCSAKDTCCYPEPVIDHVIPDPLAGNLLCTNVVIRYYFNEVMDTETMNTANIIVTDGTDPIAGKIDIHKNKKGFGFVADKPYTPGQQVHIEVTTNVKNKYGVGMAGSDSRIWTIDPAASLCAINQIDFTIITTGAPPTYDPPDVFRCATDNCSGDMDPAPGTGNEHGITAYAYDKRGLEVAATYQWQEEDDANVIAIDQLAVGTDNAITAQPNNGKANIVVTATEQYVGDSKLTDKARVSVMLCEKPWPNPYAPEMDQFPFEDSDRNPPATWKPDTIFHTNNFIANYSIWYCRDSGNPPLLERTDQVTVRDGSPTDPDIVKEYFFLRPGTSTDGIGIIVADNPDNKSPEQWYRDKFGAAAPAPQSLTVDGYPAVRAGRTVYVGVPNLVGGAFHQYIYLLSHDQEASDETLDIYNRLLANWEFNVNVDPAQKAALQRDLQRINSLEEIYGKMLAYKNKNGFFPKLEGGSYIQHLSNSKWPSWQETLGSSINSLGFIPHQAPFLEKLRGLFVKNAVAQSGLAVDPLNKFDLPDPSLPPQCLEDNGFNQDTCWNETKHLYECPANSNIYQYMVDANGDNAALYARMEYSGADSFANYFGGDPCTGITGATCNCFNYVLGVTGNLADHEGPEIQGVDALGAGVNWISSTRPLGVLVVDKPDLNPSGVNRVEFFVDGIRKFTDSDGTGPGWSWDFVSTQYADGDHKISVTAYDNVGNWTTKNYDIKIDNSSGADTTDPFIAIARPGNGASVSGKVIIEAQASDNQVLAQVQISVEGASANWVCPGGGSSMTCTTAIPNHWNTAALDADGKYIYPNGEYTINATATDAAGNSRTASIKVKVANSDYTAPSVVLTAIYNGGPDHWNNGDVIPGAIAYAQGPGEVWVWVIPTDDQGADQFYKPGRVKFYVDGIYRADGSNDNGDQVWEWAPWNTLEYSNGLHELTVYVYDDAGNMASDTWYITLNNAQSDMEPPVVNFRNAKSNPTGRTLLNGQPATQIIYIDASASDNIGVTKVYFYRDYILRSEVIVPDPMTGYSWMVDTNAISPGWHTFQVDAEDAAGNRSDAIEIRLNIGGGGAPICGDGIITNFTVPPEQCELIGYTPPPDNQPIYSMNGETCKTLGYGCGTLGCNPPLSANECQFDVSQCKNSVCGDGKIECGETCESVSDCPAAPNACSTINCNSCDCSYDQNCTNAPGCEPGTLTWCANCNHCNNKIKDCDETTTDCGGAMCPTCGCTPGNQRCTVTSQTQVCNNLGVWVNEAQTLPTCTAPPSYPFWQGDCNLGSTSGCYSGTVCKTSGATDAHCESNQAIQCTAACQTGWSLAYNQCCVTQRCNTGPPLHTEKFVSGSWVDEPQGTPICSMANGANWDGNCVMGNSCYNTTIGCMMTGGGTDAKCVNTSVNPFQCVAACQSSFLAAYNQCCAVCVDGTKQDCGATNTDVGECNIGEQTCVSGAWGPCTGEIPSSPEICTGGKDEDCDGAIDAADTDCAMQCNQACNPPSINCASPLICSSGLCRNSACPLQTDCICPTILYTITLTWSGTTDLDLNLLRSDLKRWYWGHPDIDEGIDWNNINSNTEVIEITAEQSSYPNDFQILIQNSAVPTAMIPSGTRVDIMDNIRSLTYTYNSPDMCRSNSSPIWQVGEFNFSGGVTPNVSNAYMPAPFPATYPSVPYQQASGSCCANITQCQSGLCCNGGSPGVCGACSSCFANNGSCEVAPGYSCDEVKDYSDPDNKDCKQNFIDCKTWCSDNYCDSMGNCTGFLVRMTYPVATYQYEPGKCYDPWRSGDPQDQCYISMACGGYAFYGPNNEATQCCHPASTNPPGTPLGYGCYCGRDVPVGPPVDPNPECLIASCNGPNLYVCE